MNFYTLHFLHLIRSEIGKKQTLMHGAVHPPMPQQNIWRFNWSILVVHGIVVC